MSDETEAKLRRAVQAVARLLDHAVYDWEKDDDCIAAVSYAMAVLRENPNDETIAAMLEARK